MLILLGDTGQLRIVTIMLKMKDFKRINQQSEKNLLIWL